MSHNHWELRTHCKNGHEYVEGSFATAVKSGYSYRSCRVCRRATTKKHHQFLYYGITQEQRDQMFIAQGSCCAACGSKEHGGRGWHTDHDHVTKQVRGVLCHPCNVALGNVKDSLETLQRLIEYLAKHKGNSPNGIINSEDRYHDRVLQEAIL